MNSKEKLTKLINMKKNQLKTTDDIEKYNIIVELMKDDNCFFKIDLETAIGVLEFLGVAENEILSFYSELVSSQNYQDVYPEERSIITK